MKKVPILSTPSERGVSNREPLFTSKRLPAVCDIYQVVDDASVSAYMRKIHQPPTRVLSGNVTGLGTHGVRHFTRVPISSKPNQSAMRPMEMPRLCQRTVRIFINKEEPRICQRTVRASSQTSEQDFQADVFSQSTVRSVRLHHILGKLQVVPVGDTGTIPRSWREACPGASRRGQQSGGS